MSEERSIASRGSASTGPSSGVGCQEGPPVPDCDGSFDYYPAVSWKCKLKCSKLTSWSDHNPGRRYYRCRKAWTAQDCGFFQWIDPKYNDFLSTLLLDLRDAVRTLKRDVAEEIEASMRLHNMYAQQVQHKEKQILDLDKQLGEKDAAFQGLAARKAFGRQMSSLVFVFIVGGSVWWVLEGYYGKSRQLEE